MPSPFTIIQGKELANPGAPLVLCQITAVDGNTVYLSTKASNGNPYITYNGHNWLCRIQNQVIDAIQAQSPQGFDIPGSVNLTIGDGDFFLWRNHANPHGWRGATLTITFLLWDVPTDTYSTDAYAWTFICGKPKIKDTGVLTVEAMAKASMTRLKVPNVPRQTRCPWTFPQTLAQRTAAANDQTSIYYQCGYSPDVVGGVGNLNSGVAFTDCDYTRQTCVLHGMFSTDSSSNTTGRFGGDTLIAPIQWSGRQYSSGNKIYGFNTPNPPGNEYYPMVFGTQWVDCVVHEPMAEANSLRGEATVCLAAHGSANVLKLQVNGVEIPHEVPGTGQDPLFIWRYTNQGGRNGHIQTDALFDGRGDPHGSFCTVEWVVPDELANGGKPPVQAQTQQPPTLQFDVSGNPVYAYSTNPVWHLLELLTWGPYALTDFDPASWYSAAAICDVSINYLNLTGATASHARYRSSFVLENSNRQTMAEAVKAIRASAGILLSRNPLTGLIQCSIEQTLADQQPSPVAGSNYNTPVTSKHADNSAGTGYYAYLFDGAGSIEKGTFELSGRSINDIPNRVAFQFQDEDNDWQQDSLSQVDPDGYVASGNQQVDAPLSILGICNFDEGGRRSNVELSKALRGNARDDAGGTELPVFTTTVKAAHLLGQVGAICGLSYEQILG